MTIRVRLGAPKGMVGEVLEFTGVDARIPECGRLEIHRGDVLVAAYQADAWVGFESIDTEGA